MNLLPRLIRLRDAPGYCGMDVNRFNAEVRPDVPEIPIGTQGVAFDRLDLDAWVDQYKERNGRPGKVATKKGGEKWAEKPHQGSSNAVKSGTYRRSSEVVEFEKALEQATSRKQKDS